MNAKYRKTLKCKIGRLNQKISFELEGIKMNAQWLIDHINEPNQIAFFEKSRMIAQSETEIKVFIATRDAVQQILNEVESC
jgi:hypothetical protein